MKRSFGQFLRRVLLPVMGVSLAGFSVGCSDKTSNPDAVTIQDLKGPGDLRILDTGNGGVILNWNGANNETDFDGYNVYGMHSTAGDGSDLGVPAKAGVGAPLQLLNSDDTPDPAAKTTLGNFDYDPTSKTPLEAKATAAAAASTSTDSSTDTPDFSARPIHTLGADGTSKLLPTCKPSAGTAGPTDPSGNECAMTTAATAGQSGAAYALNGDISFDLLAQAKQTLVVGETYCFFVLSSMKEGAKVSQTSSSVACVTPKYDKSMALTLPKDGNNDDALKIDFNGWVKACTANTCPDPVAGTPAFVAKDQPGVDATPPTTARNNHNGSDTGPLYVEYGSNGPGFVAGKGCGLQDLGFYAQGLADPSLPAVADTFVPDAAADVLADGVTPIFNGGGYSLAGQTLPMLAQHIYVLAVPDATTATKFRYFWLYLNDTAQYSISSTTANVQVRLPHDAL